MILIKSSYLLISHEHSNAMKTQFLIALLFIISVSVSGQNDTAKQHDKIEEVELIGIVESMPEFIGGFEALMK